MMKKVFVDQGHGLPWPGAVHGEIQEHVIVFNVGQVLEQELRRRGYVVLKTRDNEKALLASDRTADLEARAEKANKFQADIFISLHCNSVDSPTASGVETWYWFSSEQGKRLAFLVQNSLIKQFGMKDRGIKPNSGYIVLKKSQMPGVLVELGFISNEEDRRKLTAADYSKKVAEAISNSIDAYFKGGK